MKKKIMSVLEIGLACIVGFFAFYGMLCFVKAIAERAADNSKTEEMPHSINYTKYSLTNDGKNDLLIITGNGIVSKEIIDMFEDIEAIYVCEGISGVEPDAFRDAEELKVLIMPDDLYSYGMELPGLTDLYYIEENGYREFLQLFS